MKDVQALTGREQDPGGDQHRRRQRCHHVPGPPGGAQREHQQHHDRHRADDREAERPQPIPLIKPIKVALQVEQCHPRSIVLT